MKEAADHPITAWLVMGFSVLVFFLLIKAAVTFVPESVTWFNPFKQVILAA